ncbi:Clavaminate synthase-like protein [Aspergillus karnatakaensis]|uniref:Clavaminate synthase-like protein n=1 Tax=Aspergillus karnatakaensis TaxID=1810916 RepID=UPI003CCD3E73
MHFPIISLKNLKSDFTTISRDVFKASQERGFFIVIDHGISGVESMFTISRQFFDLTPEVKREKTLNELGLGYDGHNATHFAASERMALGLPAGQLYHCADIHDWWDCVKINQIEAFKAQCNDLTLLLLSCFAEHLNLPRTFFEASHGQGLPGNALKLMKYPKMEAKPDDTPERLSAHTDWESLTLLFTESPGLEIRDPNGNWHDVPVIPGGIVVNIGDLLSFWSGKKLKSTMHRISWEKVPVHQDRYSIPYFAQPSFDTELRSLTGTDDTDGEPLTYKDYYRTRIRLTWGSTIDDGKGDVEKVDNRLANYLGLDPVPPAPAGVSVEKHAASGWAGVWEKVRVLYRRLF